MSSKVVVIVVLIAVAVGFTATLGFGVVNHSRRPAGDLGSPPPMRGDQVDEDAVEDWRPPDAASTVANVVGRFTPSLQLTCPGVTVQGLATETRRAPSSGARLRVGRVTLMSGAGAMVEYECRDEKGRTCPQRACVCEAGAALEADRADACGNGWLRSRRQGDRIICREGDEAVSLVIYPEGGPLAFSSLGATAQLTVR